MGFGPMCATLIALTSIDAFVKPEARQSSSPCQVQTTAEVQQPTISHLGRHYRIRYQPRNRKIVLQQGSRQILIEAFSKNYDPSLVGSDTVIKFLPEALQVYRRENLLIYVSSTRTVGGNGSGQCGSGSEISLRFLDVSTSQPKIKSSLLVGSCEKSIELDDQDLSQGAIGTISRMGDRLSLRFLSYGSREGSLDAVVAEDLRSLRFQQGE